MSYLFHKEINNWDSWGAVYQSIEDFRPLIQEIFEREQLAGSADISLLKPGTNAVFKAGCYVIKIFAPTQSGLNTDQDYHAELLSMQRAINHGIRTPRIVAASTIVDKYVFKYMIMDYIEGQSAGDAIRSFTLLQKRQFVGKLQCDLAKLNTLPDQQISREAVIERAVHNDRWKVVSPVVRLQIADFLSAYEITTCVNVHGDLTGDNVLIDPTENVYIIDFADSTLAPAEYEYPPIVFELFHSDAAAVNLFLQGLEMNYDRFIDQLFAGTILHDFGANFVKDIYETYTGRNVRELSDIAEIKRLIYAQLHV